jgi:UDP-N-acetylglucosamine 2-epimerase (non-hydrolysing)
MNGSTCRSWSHPRTRKRLEQLGRELPTGLMFHKPLGFIDYVRLQQDALCVLSDSGTISEESSILGFPAVTLRDSIERPEALDTGCIIMTGLDPENIVEGISMTIADPEAGHTVPVDYAIDNCSERAVRFIVSTHRRHEQWSGLRGR